MSSKTTKTEDWKIKLKEERNALMDSTLKLKSFMDNPETKLNQKEWDMLQRQFQNMRGYLQSLTDRCIYYDIIKGGDLNLFY